MSPVDLPEKNEKHIFDYTQKLNTLEPSKYEALSDDELELKIQMAIDKQNMFEKQEEFPNRHHFSTIKEDSMEVISERNSEEFQTKRESGMSDKLSGLNKD